MLRLYPTIHDRRLNNDSFVAHAAGDALLVKVFQQRDGIFPGHAEQVFKGPNVDFRRLGLLRGHDLA
jgi:hypothetical protein